VHYSGHVGEAFARTTEEGLVGPVFDGMTDELRHRLTVDGRGPLELLVQLGIETEAPHRANVSQRGRIVIHPDPARERHGIMVPGAGSPMDDPPTS